MLNIALELMQICSKHFFSISPFLLLAIPGCPAGAFEQSHALYTKAYISRETQCTNVFRTRKSNNYHNLNLLPSLPFVCKIFINASPVRDAPDISSQIAKLKSDLQACNMQLRSKVILVNEV